MHGDESGNGTDCNIDGNDTEIDADELQDISSTFEIDEDGSSGENSDTNIAPWLAINASIPSGKAGLDLRGLLRDEFQGDLGRWSSILVVYRACNTRIHGRW